MDRDGDRNRHRDRRRSRSHDRSRDRYHRDRRRSRSRERRSSSRDRDARKRSPEHDSHSRVDREGRIDDGAGSRRERKRRGMWDIDASGNSLPTGVGSDSCASMNALPMVANPMAALQQQAMMTALLQQQAAVTRRARRLHVGNLPPGLTAGALKELFNSTMQVCA